MVKARLGDLVTDLEGKRNFSLTAYPEVSIQVKASYGDLQTVQWWITQEEFEQNVVLVCVLMREEINEEKNEYNLILAGFLPTEMMKVRSLLRLG